MREILFRGKCGREWSEGCLIKRGDTYCIYPQGKVCEGENCSMTMMVWHEVNPETIGQFTGLTDKNGKKIFEGDILYIKASHGIECVVGNAIVYYDKELFQYRVRSTKPFGIIYCDFTHIDRFEVIGNIYDNPELLKAVEE